jgi:NAD-dependent SIR2 family protein deacetylase
MKHARCVKCGKWHPAHKVILVECPACVYRTARCHDCGGAQGAVRSLRGHWAFYRARRHEDGGHLERLRSWFRKEVKS